MCVSGDLAQVTEQESLRNLNQKYGSIFKISHIPGMRDLVCLFDADDIETVSTIKK